MVANSLKERQIHEGPRYLKKQYIKTRLSSMCIISSYYTTRGQTLIKVNENVSSVKCVRKKILNKSWHNTR